jgi:hypothetical protein
MGRPLILALALLLGACTNSGTDPAERGGFVSVTPTNERGAQHTTQAREPRFTVEGNTLYGGRFSPESEPVSTHFNANHRIVVSFSEKTLRYFRRDGETWQGMLGFAVITPKPREIPQPEVVGRVRRIDQTPQWCPTDTIRRAKPELPAGCLPYRHPKNPMGTAKFLIDWPIASWQYVRLHGHKTYPSNWQSVDTFGCVRLLDPAMEELIVTMGANAVSEGIVVIFRR